MAAAFASHLEKVDAKPQKRAPIMTPKDRDRILDFTPIGMWWEITKSTADTGGELFEATNMVNPGFAGPPLHIRAKAEYGSRHRFAARSKFPATPSHPPHHVESS
jgi:hypothetical protein